MLLQIYKKQRAITRGSSEMPGRFFQRVFLIPCSQNRSRRCILQNYHNIQRPENREER